MKFSVPCLFLIFTIGFLSCRKDRTECTSDEEIVIRFDSMTYTFAPNGFPIKWEDEKDNSNEQWTFNSDGVIQRRTGFYDSGLGWTDYAYSWEEDTCTITIEREGFPEAITQKVVFDTDSTILSYESTPYYYVDNQLHSILGSPFDTYFYYEGEKLIKIEQFHNESGNLYSSYYFIYDDEGRLIDERKQFNSWGTVNRYEYTPLGQITKIYFSELNADGEIVEDAEYLVEQTGCGTPLPLVPINRFRYSYLRSHVVEVSLW